ncbi:hypothetical protein ACFQS1_37350 [Paractinoplanes rhizophilus]|uniref:Uncharacterized protein n=1 Tax=Paractinoplanes rhizophilus TaxID=1416877 RepID=A0ABW2I438_9ACTN
MRFERPRGLDFGRRLLGGRTLAGLTANAQQLLTVPLGEAPISMPGVFAAEFFRLGRIIARRAAITHFCQLARGEQLQLSHSRIISPRGMRR